MRKLLCLLYLASAALLFPGGVDDAFAQTESEKAPVDTPNEAPAEESLTEAVDQESEPEDSSPGRFFIEGGPAFAFFSGGGANEPGAGFGLGVGFMEQESNEDFGIGVRATYARQVYQKILGISGQELREYFFTLDVMIESPRAGNIASFYGYGRLGGVIGDVTTPFGSKKEGGAVIGLGGGGRLYIWKGIYASGDLGYMIALGSITEWAQFNFHAAGNIGWRF